VGAGVDVVVTAGTSAALEVVVASETVVSEVEGAIASGAPVLPVVVHAVANITTSVGKDRFIVAAYDDSISRPD
jgi:hypothetical protein